MEQHNGNWSNISNIVALNKTYMLTHNKNVVKYCVMMDIICIRRLEWQPTATGDTHKSIVRDLIERNIPKLWHLGAR